MNNVHAMNQSNRLSQMLSPVVRRMAVVALLALPLAATAAEQRTYPTPEAAVDALVAALKANDEGALVAIFGEQHRSIVIAGDASTRADVAGQLAIFRTLDDRGPDRRVLLVGAGAWPLPIPLVRQAGAWRFASEEGVEELVNRRIGSNERNAIHVLRAYIDAQRQYASRDRDGDGVLQYAQKLASAPGKHDGLYWPADNDDEISPFGPLIAESSYLAGHRKGDPYRGYHFRILARQGGSAPGGAYNYVINGRMIAGFAMVAYPAAHGESGVMTFAVNHNGKVYESNLGPRTAGIGAKMTEFNPDADWKEVVP